MSSDERISLTRSISETLFGGSKKRKINEANNQQKQKKVKVDNKKKQEEFNKREEEFDKLLKPEDRKWRPRGYKLNPPPSNRPIRIYADGVFDLFHLGHMKQLEQCKKTFKNVELIIGVPNDHETHKRKGLTVLTDKQRYETVRHCKWVDEVIEDAPWILSMDFLKKHKIDYCAHDDLPYVADGIDDIYKPMKEAGMFIATQRTDGISTSDLITKIIKDYDKYLMRNFDRGATRQELNVSWLKKNELDVKRHLSDFRETLKQTNDKYTHFSKDLYTIVRESLIKSNTLPLRPSPLEKFARKFNANGLQRNNSSNKSIINTVMDWVGFQSEPNSEIDDDVISSDNEKVVNNKVSLKSKQKKYQQQQPQRKIIVPKKVKRI